MGMSPHVARLRAAIGHELIMLACVSVLRRTGLLGVFGGRDYEITYPNGDVVGYVTVTYSADIGSGVPVADGDELAGLGWFAPDELAAAPLSRFARALLGECGYLDGVRR